MHDNNLKNKVILVTGAGGFIGSHLTERLLDMGSKVTAFLRYNSRSDFGFLNKVEHDNLEILQGDLRDQHSVLEAVRDKDLIFHLGALIAIQMMMHGGEMLFQIEDMNWELISVMSELLQ